MKNKTNPTVGISFNHDNPQDFMESLVDCFEFNNIPSEKLLELMAGISSRSMMVLCELLPPKQAAILLRAHIGDIEEVLKDRLNINITITEKR